MSSALTVPSAFVATMAMVAQGAAASHEAGAGTLGAIREVVERIGASTLAFQTETAALKREVVEVRADVERRDLAGRTERADMTSLIHEMRHFVRGAGPVSQTPVIEDLGVICAIEHLCDRVEMYAEAFDKPLSEAPDGLEWLQQIQSWLITLSQNHVGKMPLLDEKGHRELMVEGKLTSSQEMMLRNGRLGERLRLNYMALRRAFPDYDKRGVLLGRIQSLFPGKACLDKLVYQYVQKEQIVLEVMKKSVSRSHLTSIPIARWGFYGYNYVEAQKFMLDINLPLDEILKIIEDKNPVAIEPRIVFSRATYVSEFILRRLRAVLQKSLIEAPMFCELPTLMARIRQVADVIGITVTCREAEMNIMDVAKPFFKGAAFEMMDL